MTWATKHIADLRQGKTVQFRPRGQSMRPRIESGALCTVAPLSDSLQPKVGDVVLCSVAGEHYLHIVKEIKDGAYLIGNNHGRINGWTTRIYGILVGVEP